MGPDVAEERDGKAVVGDGGEDEIVRRDFKINDPPPHVAASTYHVGGKDRREMRRNR